MFKSLTVRVSIALIAVLTVVMAVFTFYFVNWRTEAMRESLLSKGRSAALTGAHIIGRTLENIADNGFFSIDELFDTNYTAIPNTDPMKYHTLYDSYLDNTILSIEDEFLKDHDVVYAALVDRNGYVPVHNARYQKPLTGDYEKDLVGNRTKRIFDDPIGLAAARNREPILFQEYHKDTGEVTWDISAPVWVKGRHWGAFRVGFSMVVLDEKVAALRNSMIAAIALMLLAACTCIYIVTHTLFKPVKELAKATKIVAGGDMDYRVAMVRNDELGELAIDFNYMTESLKASTEEREKLYTELQKYTKRLEQKVVDLEIKIDEKKKETHVKHITESDYFKDILEKIDELKDKD